MTTTTNFKSIPLLRQWCMLTLPTVFNEALSYDEQVCKLTQAINEMATTINGLPDYIIELVKELLDQMNLEEIVKQVLADYFFINVKNPPAPLVAAKGDGIANDTAAIQAMINYVSGKKNYLFFPAGIYSVNQLTMMRNVSLVGQDRYHAIINLEAGSNVDLLTGEMGNCTISNLTLSANMPGQTQNCSVYQGSVGNMLIDSVIFKNAYNVVSFDIDGLVQMDNIIVDGTQGNGLSIGGIRCYISNVEFINTSLLNSETLIVVSGNNNNINMRCYDVIKSALNISGNNNIIKCELLNNTIPINNGINNIITINSNGSSTYFRKNETKNVESSIALNANDINVNPTNPLGYKKPSPYNEFFDSVPMKNDGTIYQVLVGNENTNLIGNVRVFKTLSELRNDVTVQLGQLINTLGFTNVGDGGAGRYKIREINSDETANGFTTFVVNGLMAELIYDGYILADQIGAIHDNLTLDCSIAVNYILNNTKATMLFMGGTYAFKNSISATSVRIVLEPNTILLMNGSTTVDNFIGINIGGTSQQRDSIIKGGTINCNQKCNNGITLNRVIQTHISDTVITNVLQAGINISASSQGNTISNVRVSNIEITAAGTYGIKSAGGDNTYIRCVVVDCQNGIQLNSADCAIECHPWISKDNMYTGSVAYVISGEGNTMTCCQSDTCEIGLNLSYSFAGLMCNNFRYFNATTGVTPAKIAAGNQKFLVSAIQARASFNGSRIQSNAGCVVTVVPDDVLNRLETNLNEYDGKITFAQTQYIADSDIQNKIVNIPPEFTNQNPNLYALSKGSSTQIVTPVNLTATNLVNDSSQMNCEKSEKMCHLYGSFTLANATSGSETSYLIQGAPLPYKPIYTWIMAFDSSARTYTPYHGIVSSNGSIGSVNTVLNTGIRYYVDIFYFTK